jgi:hypothetical protein
LVKASNFSATYTAGRFVAGSPEEAIEQAREEYRNSPIGRSLKDAGSFRFYVADEPPQRGSDD